MGKLSRLVRLPEPIPGKDGVQGRQGTQGPQGDRGPQGRLGPMPKHQIVGERLRFEIAEDTWGKWIDFPTGGGASNQYLKGNTAPGVYYTQVTDATHTIRPGHLKAGTNIFGVATGVLTTIYLPASSMSSNKIIHIKDELGGAASNNIIVKLEGT